MGYTITLVLVKRGETSVRMRRFHSVAANLREATQVMLEARRTAEGSGGKVLGYSVVPSGVGL